MKQPSPAFSWTFVILAALFLRPVAAQDGCSEIEVNEPPDSKGGKGDGYDPEETKRKNEGLAGGGGADEGDPDAPKVKMSLQERINEAIKRGVVWLKKAQHKDGSYGPCHGERKYDSTEPGGDCYFSGPTSFSLYTLAKCGVKKSDPVMRKGYKWLNENYRKTQIWTDAVKPAGAEGSMVTYEVASLIMMLEAMHEESAKLTGKQDMRKLETDNPLQPPERSRFPKEDWQWMHQGILFLTSGKGPVKKGTTWNGCQNKTGGWRYGQASGDQDMSATQFALLGLRAASLAGYPVRPEVWTSALNFVKSMQDPSGASPYRKGEQWSAGMTAAAAASAIICKEQLELSGQAVPAFTDELIKNSLAHLDTLFDVTQNQGTHHGGSYHYYYLYGIERIGDLTGRNEFNGKNWYVRGAEFLIANQDVEGKWVDSSCMKPTDILGTCFALLFLKRATVPTVTVTGN